MKKYREYMDNIQAPDTLHQRLAGLEAPEKRPVPWKRYGAMAAALALALGLSGYGVHYWNTVVNPTGQAFLERTMDFDPELAPAATPDIALVEPGDVTEPGEKTIGGYEVVSGSGENAIATYYILPYIDYGASHMVPSVSSTSTSYMMDWDIPQGAVRRDLTRDEIVALMGGEDAVTTHLDWGGYELSGWAAWDEDGSFWGAYINGFEGDFSVGVSNSFEFTVTAGQLPPTCNVYEGGVTQEIRGLTVDAEGHDSVAGPEGGADNSIRRVSFMTGVMKGAYGYRFEASGASRALTEERVSRLVAWIADKGLALTYTCNVCGNTFPFGAVHNDPDICHYPLDPPQYEAPPVSVSDPPRSKGEDWCGTPKDPWEISDGHPLAPEGWTGPSGSFG